jgi:predicted permease
METIFKDIRYSVRSLLKRPGFALITIATLALGIGANTALFSVVNGVLLNPLPFSQPEQLVTLDQSKPNFETGSIPYPNFLDLRKDNRTGFSFIGLGEPERVDGRYVSADFCSVFNLKPTLGRAFAPGEDEPGAGPVVLISADLWQRKFGGAQDVLGRALTLDDKSYAIVGVLPPDFNLFRDASVYVPIGQWNAPGLKSRAAGLGLHGMGRLKPGVTIDQAQADLNGVMQSLALIYPDTNKGSGAKVTALKERVVGNIRTTLWMLLGAVGFVLLIACVNVSNLLLARSTGKMREFAIRAALGAGQWRLLRQSLTESMLLAVIGGGLGLVVASWSTQIALSLLPMTLPRANEVQLDGRVLLFTFGISLLTGILAGLAPALKNSQWRLSSSLKEGGRGASTLRHRTQSILVGVEIALALCLLIGAGLMIRSLSALWKVDPGFRADNAVTFGLSLPPSVRTSSPAAIRADLRDLNEKLSSVTGVEAISFSAASFPLADEDDDGFLIEGQPKPSSQSETPSALIYRVEPGYLNAMGISLRRGRFFTAQDDERVAPVLVVDDVLAQKYFPNADPLGKRIDFDGNAAEIVGVVTHVKQWAIDSDDKQTVQAQLYVPLRQMADDAMARLAITSRVVVRANAVTPALLNSVRSVVRKQSSQNVIFETQTVNEVIGESLAAQRFLMILLDSFAVIALLLASIGLYGVISYLVGQRTHELGIRLALGAQRHRILRLVLLQGMKMAMGGVTVGLVAAFGLTRLLTNMLYGVSPTDPATFAVIALLLIIVTLLACLVPARRATKVDPLVALRYE